MPYFNKLYLNYRDQSHIKFISVNVNTLPGARNKAYLYFKRMNWDLPLYFDKDDIVDEFFTYKSNPATFIIAPGSKVAFFHSKRRSAKKYIAIMSKQLAKLKQGHHN